MNIWVEFFREEDFIKNESTKSRRYFTKHKDAMDFVSRLQEQGYHTTIKEDQSL
jgi:hypothetical protein